MTDVTCAKCGGKLPRNGQGRPRKRCEKCSPSRAKQRLAVVLPVDSAGRMTERTRQALIEADRLDTYLGGAALTLAERIDSGQDAGSSLAALVKQYTVTMSDATAGANVVASPMDELRARRAAKHG